MLDCATQTYYSIEAPGVLRSNAVYNVAINLFEAPKSCDVRISISGGEFNVDKVIKVHPWTSRMLSFEIPDIKPDEKYFLEAEGLENDEIKAKNELFLEKGNHIVLIQCDKQAYKKGDNVDFRIVFLEPNFLKPAVLEKPANICIKHLEDVVLQISDIKINKGVCSSQWHIPNDAAHGLYEIEVHVNKELIKSKSFEIIDYKAPKFDVKIITPTNVLYAQKQLFISIGANFFDGTPVKGHCTMEVETVGGFYSGVYLEKNMPFNGNIQNTIVDFVDDLKIDSTFEDMEYFVEVSIMVKVTVTDENTNEKATSMELVLVKKHEKDENVKEEIECEENVQQNDSEFGAQTPQPKNMDKNAAIEILDLRNDALAGDALNVVFKLNKPTKYVAYVITARGTVLKSDFLKIDNYQQPVKFSIETNFQFVPRAFVLAYFVYDGVFYFDEKAFDLAEEFDAKLNITKPQICEPGSSVAIEVETTPNSLVSLMAVDMKSVILNAENDIKQYEIFNTLRDLRSRSVYIKGIGRYPGLISGLLTLSNAKIDGLELAEDNSFFDREHILLTDDMCRNGIDEFKKDAIRTKQEYEQVYGNWFFVDKESDKSGLMQFETKLPDHTTTWLLTVFAVSDLKGFTMLKEPSDITTVSESKKQDDSPSLVLEKRKVLNKSTEIVFENYSGTLKQMTYDIEILPKSKPLEITFTITESLFGHAIAHLSDHADVMYATGHLHMTTVIPNINVLEYLDSINQLESELALGIKSRFPAAIQRELADAHDSDGSFSWFPNDPEGSPHMTSLVLQAFQRASKYVDIDPNVIKKGLNYLVSQQLPSGEIAKEKDPFRYPFQQNCGVGLTSMVLLAFLMEKQVKTEYEDFINKSFDYIVSNLETVVQVYDLALAFYAMQLAKHSYATVLKEKLFKIAKTNPIKDHKWWSYNLLNHIDAGDADDLPVNELEITSYILLGLLETESIETLLPIIKWMLPRNEFPNETMDRAVASDAILKIAVKYGAGSGVMEVEYKAFAENDSFNGKIFLTPENSGRILMQVLPINTSKVQISTKHNGTFYGKISCRYEVI